MPAATPRLRTGVLVLLVLAALSGGGFLVNSQLNRGDNGTTGAGSGLGTVSGGGSGSGTSPSTLPADRPSEDPSIEPEPEPAVAGPVTVGEPGELAGRVAAMFEIYFGGINDGDAGRALSVVEPSTKLDPSDPEDVENFRRDISTTHDDDIRLGSVVDTGATISAGLTFRSRQDAGYGPRGEADQTCTRWTMRYSLADDGGALRIRAVTAKHTGC